MAEESLQQRLERARQLMAARRVDGQPSTGSGAVQPRTGWEADPAAAELRQRQLQLQQLGLANPYFRAHESVSGDTIRVDGRELLNFSGYNYLGLSGHPEVSAAAKAAIDQFGTSASGSRLASGETPLHGELERSLASLLGVEACLVFVSGYGTNVSTIGHLLGRRDLVVHDALAHSSILAGCQLSGAHRLPFRHNSPEALEAVLSEHRRTYERALIVVEGVYSMDGDIAPMKEFVDIKHRHDAALMVDEAHSLGVLGDRGAGVGEHFRLSPTDVDVWMGTLSKALAACGGYVAGSANLIEYLRFTAPGFIFSVGLPPADTAAALAALRIMLREPERVDRVRLRGAHFLARARARGLNTGASDGSAVVPVIIGDSLRAIRVAQNLFEAGINVQPIVYPAVDEQAARLRYFITASHTEAQIERAVDATAEALCAS
ncbi:MAG TPA: aminotransferase class I/II-fold pyridoxal phosphate-dependent enzyme [Chloroflexota bacterium]|nr:aminotransferase class I/II-fold pyridoxal phosphate-dependent enzyme [Chloroflexota bacterium]